MEEEQKFDETLDTTGFHLPKKIIVLPNADKGYHEKWYFGRDLMNIPHPFRMVIASRPNSGKSNIIKNILLRTGVSKEPFQEVIIVHCDSDYTKEFDDIDCEMMNDIPSPEQFLGQVKTLVILEDISLIGMNKEQKSNLDRLFSFCSTHKHCSVILTNQNPFSIQPNIRRCCNFFIFWDSHDVDSLSTLARKSGLTGDEMRRIFKTFTDFHDSLWIDLTPGSPARLRKNCYDIL